VPRTREALTPAEERRTTLDEKIKRLEAALG
jgi:hypothetical protein